MFDIYTIIFLALAVFIFLRLRSVLGQRTGRERPPYDPYSSAPGAIRPAAPGDKVVALPGRAPDTAQKTAEPAEPVDRWKGIAEPGSALDAAIGLAERISGNGPLAVAATKRIIVESRGWSPEEMWTKQNKILAPVFMSNDAREGAVAFAEKRQPNWTGS